MPCRSDYDAEDADRLRVELERVTRVACELSGYIDGSRIYPINNLSKETRNWIKEHELKDRECLKREREEADRLSMRKKALKKLTPEERRLLGI
jgi:hypothetical protein